MRILLLLIVLLVLSASIGRCLMSDGQGDLDLRDQAQFVGNRSCVRCHPLQQNLWQGSHHDLAMQEPNAETVLGNFADASFTHLGVTSRFFRRDGKFVINTEGADGELQDFEIAYTFGVDPLQQYLVEFPDGRIQALSLCWDSRPAAAGGQRWFHLYPDERIDSEDELHWTAPSQNWNYMCADCHSTNLQKNYDFEGNRFASTWSEIDVSCEACHGPASEHLAWAEAKERGETPEYDEDLGLLLQLKEDYRWVFAEDAVTAHRVPAQPASSELETCAPCHSRRSQMAEDRRAGDALFDRYRLSNLDRDLYHADGQIQDEVYVYGSFLQSRMYHQGVSCRDCHEPHSLQLRAQGNNLCLTCHQGNFYGGFEHSRHEPGTPGAQCVNCHMRSETYMVVDPRRDHSIRIPRPDLSTKLGSPNACNDCHADKTAHWAAEAIASWRGGEYSPAKHFGEALHLGRQGAPGWQGALLGLLRDKEQPNIARASALELIAERGMILPAEELRTLLEDPDPVLRLAALQSVEGLPPEVRPEMGVAVLEDELRVPRSEAARILSPSTQFVEERSRELLERALAEYSDSQTFNADRPWAHLNLGLLKASQGDLQAAGNHYEDALRLDPKAVAARVNLADLYRQLGDSEACEEVILKGLELLPDSAEFEHARGLLLVREGQPRAAQIPLARAAELRPENPRFAYVYAVALHAEDPLAAIRVLEKAQQQHPWNEELLFGLASFERDRGRLPTAISWAEKLVQISLQPGARDFLAQLRAQDKR
ncbi:MAG: tetratricopeptide repeat protein [Planctomycetota bacterium]